MLVCDRCGDSRRNTSWAKVEGVSITMQILDSEESATLSSLTDLCGDYRKTVKAAIQKLIGPLPVAVGAK